MAGPKPWIAALALLLAGCLGGTPGPSATTPPTLEAAAVAPETLAAPPAEARDLTFTETPISYSGKTATAACAHAETTAACQAADEGSETHHAVALDGRPVLLKGTATHASTAPGGTFGVYVCIERAGGAFECLKGFEGASPIAFEWDLSAFANAKSLMVGAYQTVEPAGSLPAQAWAFTPAEFKVEGALTTLNV